MFLFKYEEHLNTRGRPTMGYAIFTARKLMLTNRKNQLEFRIMQLSQQQQTLANNAANLERAMANYKTMFQNIGNIFQTAYSTQMSQLYSQAGITAGTGALPGNLGNIFSMGMAGANFMATPMGMSISMMSQYIDAVNNSKMQQVKNMETNIELQRKSLETQLNATVKELESVEKQEEKEIERSAPKFA